MAKMIEMQPIVHIESDKGMVEAIYNALEYRITNDKSLVEGTEDYARTWEMFHVLADILNALNGHGFPMGVDNITNGGH